MQRVYVATRYIYTLPNNRVHAVRSIGKNVKYSSIPRVPVHILTGNEYIHIYIYSNQITYYTTTTYNQTILHSTKCVASTYYSYGKYVA